MADSDAAERSTGIDLEILENIDKRISEGWCFNPGYREQLLPAVVQARTTKRQATIIKSVTIDHPNHTFETNEEAQAFVQQRAAEGSEYHIAALIYIAKCRLT